MTTKRKIAVAAITITAIAGLAGAGYVAYRYRKQIDDRIREQGYDLDWLNDFSSRIRHKLKI